MFHMEKLTANSDFSSEKFYLGKLCKRGHAWRGTEQTVRLKSNKACRICLTELATKPKTERTRKNGLVPQEYLQKNVEIVGDCWIWIGSLHGSTPRKSYGKWLNTKLVGGQKMSGAKAHRVSYILHYGDIPEGMVVRHKCDTPSCVNPLHLELGTFADNNRDRDERGRWRNWYAMPEHANHPRVVASRRN